MRENTIDLNFTELISKIGMNRSILDVEPPKVYIISCAVKGECWDEINLHEIKRQEKLQNTWGEKTNIRFRKPKSTGNLSKKNEDREEKP